MKPVDRVLQERFDGLKETASIGVYLLKQARNYVELSAVGGDEDAEQLLEHIDEYLYLEEDNGRP